MKIQTRNWTIVLLIPLALMAILHSHFNAEAIMAMYLGITVFIILVWAFEVLPSVQAAILLPLLYIVFGIAPIEKVFQPWLTFLPWVCVAGLVFGDILGRTGLARRIALLCVKIMGGSFTSIAVGLMLAGILLAALVPSIMARVVIFYAVTCGFADALGLEKKSRLSSGVLMSGFFAATSPAIIYMTGAEQNLLGINMINMNEEVITWGGYLLDNLPAGLVYCCLSVVFAHLIKGRESLPPKDLVKKEVAEQLAAMGKFTSAEFKTLALLVFGVSAFVALGANEGPWLFVIAACLAFFPGFSLINEQQLRGLNFGFIFFVTGCMAIGFAAGHLGLPKMIGDWMAPVLQGESGLMCVLLSYGAGLGLNFLLTPLAATASMGGPLVAVAAELGMSPLPFVYSFLYGLDQYIFPYEYALLLFFFMDSRVTLSHIIPPLAARMVTTLVILAAVAYPWWMLRGII